LLFCFFFNAHWIHKREEHGKKIVIFSISIEQTFQRINIIVFIIPEIIMATSCELTDSCTDRAIISIGIVTGIVFGSLIGMAIIISIISILCKKKKQAPAVWVQNPVYSSAVVQNQAADIGPYQLYGEPFGFSEPPPAYEPENRPVVSSEKVEA
jgi:hypothetical protein